MAAVVPPFTHVAISYGALSLTLYITTPPTPGVGSMPRIPNATRGFPAHVPMNGLLPIRRMYVSRFSFRGVPRTTALGRPTTGGRATSHPMRALTPRPWNRWRLSWRGAWAEWYVCTGSLREKRHTSPCSA